ncbi:hypothetical protein WJX72_009846 [[Myrmecia] bisecta]|uniref:DUF1995 domain-containing protein n=1 Tax=[Myrmecia] bisecta TaxID=41462 RepID=A0AAW1PY25_9CHLO
MQGRSSAKSLDRPEALETSPQLQRFPEAYPQAIRQAQVAVTAALADGCKLLEVEFPTASLASVPGDAEGANEMTLSMGFLRQFCRIFQTKADSVRIFFPDEKELQVAKRGLSSKTAENIGGDFDVTRFNLDYLTKPTGLLDLGIDINKFNLATRAQATDDLFIIAYPHFNVNEMIAVEELYSGAAEASGVPIIVFNGELDRIRSGYYPSLFYPKIGRLAKQFIPKFEVCYYIHNFKGTRGGVLFRCYPGPWQVLRRQGDDLQLIHTQETAPSLKDVALNILK